jgi:hypothetical protein
MQIASASTGVITIGRPFVSPAFDLMLIGGGLTYPLALWLLWDGSSAATSIALAIPVVALLVNQAHFAASTVRLYTKPGAFQSLPFLSMVLPLVTLVAVTAFVFLAGSWGRHLWALSLTWSPYHYAAQAFGLSSMYCIRSGCPLSDAERRFLRWACLMPFFKGFLGGTGAGYGLGWFVPAADLVATPGAALAFTLASRILDVLIFAMPLALFVHLARRARAPRSGANDGAGSKDAGRAAMPLVSLLVVLSNGMWFVFFDFYNAFVWATVFHGIQYLAIVGIFHVRDQRKAPERSRGGLTQVAIFYGICVVLGYALFQCWPYGYVLAGFGTVESTLMVIAAINVHHFIVDGFIWRIRKDPNYQTVISTNS